jgi:undecaprenyl-diphosphatase
MKVDKQRQKWYKILIFLNFESLNNSRQTKIPDMINLKTFLISLFLFTLTPFSFFAQNLDIDILESLNCEKKCPLDNIMTGISDVSYILDISMPATVGLTGLIGHDKDLFYKGIEMGAAAFVNAAITYSMKKIINRDRPYETYPELVVAKSSSGSASFPSGHTSASFTTATTLSLNFPKWYVIVPSYVWASAVGYSRIYLGVHYPSDVLAGAIIGSGSAYLTFKINKWLQKKYDYKNEIKLRILEQTY